MTNTYYRGDPRISWFLVLWGNHEMWGLWIPGTLNVLKPQNGSKDFQKSTCWVNLHRSFYYFWEKSKEYALNFLSQIRVLTKLGQIKSFYIDIQQVKGLKLIIIFEKNSKFFWFIILPLQNHEIENHILWNHDIGIPCIVYSVQKIDSRGRLSLLTFR